MKATHLLFGGLALTALVVTYGAVRAANTGSKLELEPLPKFRKLDFEGLQIEIDAKFKNPTNGSLALRIIAETKQAFSGRYQICKFFH